MQTFAYQILFSISLKTSIDVNASKLGVCLFIFLSLEEFYLFCTLKNYMSKVVDIAVCSPTYYNLEWQRSRCFCIWNKYYTINARVMVSRPALIAFPCQDNRNQPVCARISILYTTHYHLALLTIKTHVSFTKKIHCQHSVWLNYPTLS